MKKVEVQALKEVLEAALAESDRLWDSKEQNPAYIVGYLQGSLKGAIGYIETKIEKPKK